CSARRTESSQRDERDAARHGGHPGQPLYSHTLAEERRGQERGEHDARLAHCGDLGSGCEPERREHERVGAEGGGGGEQRAPAEAWRLSTTAVPSRTSNGADPRAIG